MLMLLLHSDSRAAGCLRSIYTLFKLVLWSFSGLGLLDHTSPALRVCMQGHRWDRSWCPSQITQFKRWPPTDRTSSVYLDCRLLTWVTSELFMTVKIILRLQKWVSLLMDGKYVYYLFMMKGDKICIFSLRELKLYSWFQTKSSWSCRHSRPLWCWREQTISPHFTCVSWNIYICVETAWNRWQRWMAGIGGVFFFFFFNVTGNWSVYWTLYLQGKNFEWQ